MYCKDLERYKMQWRKMPTYCKYCKKKEKKTVISSNSQYNIEMLSLQIKYVVSLSVFKSIYVIYNLSSHLCPCAAFHFTSSMTLKDVT